MSLFTAEPVAPLAECLRPTRLADIVGQHHLLGPGRPLQVAVRCKKLHSCILWGPPGVGKTTLGRLLAKEAGYQFLSLSAVTAGVKDIKMAVEAAQYFLNEQGRGSVLFIDEIHALNRSQQDVLLPSVENGLLVLIGSTTEHPGLSVNTALLSRAHVHELKALADEDFMALWKKAAEYYRQQSKPVPALSPKAWTLLLQWADQDARKFFNACELMQQWTTQNGLEEIDDVILVTMLGASPRRQDDHGQMFYEQLSAFHKSVRGSDPNAALYWLARMLSAGADWRQLGRRLLAIASEDVGNADPQALHLALNAYEAYERLGAAEGERALAQATTYLALAPKSNAVYRAWKAAKAFAAQDISREVPLHLRNAVTPLMAQQGYGAAYRYAHDEPGAFAAGQSYWPEGLPEQIWYEPQPRGKEFELSQRWEALRARNRAAEPKKPIDGTL